MRWIDGIGWLLVGGNLLIGNFWIAGGLALLTLFCMLDEYR